MKNVDSISKISCNLCILEIIEKLKWKEHQKVVVNLKGKHIIIKDWKN